MLKQTLPAGWQFKASAERVTSDGAPSHRSVQFGTVQQKRAAVAAGFRAYKVQLRHDVTDSDNPKRAELARLILNLIQEATNFSTPCPFHTRGFLSH